MSRWRAHSALVVLLAALLLAALIGCGSSGGRETPALSPRPTPGAVTLRSDQTSYSVGQGEIQLVVENTTGESVYLPICGPWTIYRVIGPTRLVAWEMECEQDYVTYVLPPGRAVAGVLSLSDPAAEPNYLAAQPGEYLAELTVYRGCQVGEPVMVETGLKYGELADCAGQELVASPSFQIGLGEGQSASLPETSVPADQAAITSEATRAGPDWGGLEVVGQIGGTVETIAWQGGLVAAGVGPRLVVLDPERLTQVGRSALLPGLPRDIELEGGRAYLALGQGGFSIVDLARPAEPIVLGGFQPGGAVLDVDLKGRYALLAANSTGLLILDVGDPRLPRQVAHMPMDGQATAVAVQADRGYVVAGEQLLVLDISDPAAPVRLAQLELPGGGRQILVSDTVAYVAAQVDGVRVVDLTDPAQPFVAATLAARDAVVGLALVEGTLLAADYRAGLSLYDTATLELVGQLDTQGVSMSLAAQGNRLLVAAFSSGVRQVSIADRAAPAEDGPPFETLGWISAISAADGLVAVAGTAGLGLVDTSDPIAPRRQPVEAEIGWVSGNVNISGRQVYLLESQWGLHVLSLGQPVREVAAYPLPQVSALAVRDQLVYLAHAAGLQIVDVGTSPPTLIGSYSREWQPADALLRDGILYVADRADSVWVLNVANPALPVEVGRWQRSANGLELGDYVLMAAVSNRGLYTAAIANPNRPVDMGYLATSDARAALAFGQVVVVADAAAGVRVVDLQNPAEPVELGLIDTPGTAVDLATDGDHVYVADAAGGLLILSWR